MSQLRMWWGFKILPLFVVTALAQRDISDTVAIQSLMDRPGESLFLEKGNHLRFMVPTKCMDPRYQALAPEIEDRFGGGTGTTDIPVDDIELPDMSLAYELPKHERFSTFLPYHRRMAARCIEVLFGMPTRKLFATAAALIRDRMNPDLWTFCMQVVLTHRNDTQNVDVPAISALSPDKFVDGAVFRQAREEVTLLDAGERLPIEIPRDYTATDVEMEHRLAYFREDMGINLHHWTWHLVYPFAGPISIVRKDRRGELFFYQHQQIVARYNFERFSVKLGRVKPLNNFREPIEEGYFPKLDSLVASRVWPPRAAFSTLRDVNRVEQQLVYEIGDMERWRDRIYQAIHEGRVLAANMTYINILNTRGIDILGDMMEASDLNINTNVYGNLHNLGHFAISVVHDPDHRHLESFGVMGELATAMRDPTFYRWHKFVDNVFQQHKAMLRPYTPQELDYNGVTVRSVQIVSRGFPNNQLNTYWQQSDVDLSRGLDISPRGPVYARLTHLQHVPFTYRIQVNNAGAQRMGTVRIFMAPKFDERGLPMPLAEQRNLFIEMDRFFVLLRSGSNTIERSSLNSSVTIPYERTFRKLDNTQTNPTDQQYNYCGCGWPQHMLVPKGSPEGLQAELFVMVSNYADDEVVQPPPTGCTSGYSFCGWFNRKYPDRRPMGYPFDRNPRTGAETIRRFLLGNMALTDVTLRFTDRTEMRTAASPNNSQNRRSTGSRPR